MVTKKQKTKRLHFLKRHRHLKHFLIGLGLLILIIVLLIASLAIYHKVKTDRQQSALTPFYNTSGLSISGPLGQVVRIEPLGVNVPNGSGYRIIYRTQRSDGSITFSSGMVFVPNNSNSGLPRPVVAWAHGTVGMGDACAPSRTPDPVTNISWVSDMLSRGWVVTATDYAGLGTPGTEGYLVGNDEFNDVLNSVRALQYITSAQAGNTFAVWGHSQGGNSALFTAANVASYAPELHLVGTVASAPAAELVPLLNETYNTSLAWVIGPEILTSWPTIYPGLTPASVTTSYGLNNYQSIADKCITAAAVEGIVRKALNQDIFTSSAITSPVIMKAAKEQSAPILSPSQPLLVAESTTDQVVLPNTTALYIHQACSAGSDLTQLWLADVGHIQLSSTIAPEVINWIGDRFASHPTAPTCNQPTPISPASSTGT